MKKLAWACALALFSIGVCVGSLFYVVKTSDKIQDCIKQIEMLTENKEYNQAQIKSQELEDFWNQNNDMLSIILHHEIIDEIEENILLIETALMNISEENQLDLKTEITKALVKTQRLYDSEIVTLANII